MIAWQRRPRADLHQHNKPGKVPPMKTLSEIVRESLEGCGLTRAQVSRETGIDEAVLSRFARGAAMSGRNLDKLTYFLALELKPQTGKRRKDQVPAVIDFGGVRMLDTLDRELVKPAKRRKHGKGI